MLLLGLPLGKMSKFSFQSLTQLFLSLTSNYYFLNFYGLTLIINPSIEKSKLIFLNFENIRRLFKQKISHHFIIKLFPKGQTYNHNEQSTRKIRKHLGNVSLSET